MIHDVNCYLHKFTRNLKSVGVFVDTGGRGGGGVKLTAVVRNAQRCKSCTNGKWWKMVISYFSVWSDCFYLTLFDLHFCPLLGPHLLFEMPFSIRKWCFPFQINLAADVFFSCSFSPLYPSESAILFCTWRHWNTRELPVELLQAENALAVSNTAFKLGKKECFTKLNGSADSNWDLKKWTKNGGKMKQ